MSWKPGPTAVLPGTSAPSDATSPTLALDGPSEVDGLPVVDPRSYELGEELARGGMGRIVQASDRRLHRPVAIKELIETTASFRGRFEREVMITARLQHPAIVPLYEAGTWPSGEPFYAMKLVAGAPLHHVIAGCATLAERIALLPKAIAVCEAIAYAHKHGVIHRDLKPHNVLVGDFGETIVIDWGLAKDLSDVRADDDNPYRNAGNGTIVGDVMGTPAYMPPEQARGERVDERADVYSLGALLYHVLAGRAPYDTVHPAGVVAAVVVGPPVHLDELAQDLPRDLVAIVDKAMARSAADRYAHAGALVEDLVRYQTGQLVGVHRYSIGQLVRRWVRRHRAAVTIGALALVALIAVGAVAVWRVLEANDVANAQREEADRQRDTAVSQQKIAESTSAALLVEQGRTALFAGDTQRAVVYLHEALRRGNTSVALRQLLASAMRDAELAQGAIGPLAERPVSVAVTGDGRVVVAEEGGEVRVYRDGREVKHFSVGAPWRGRNEPGIQLDPTGRSVGVVYLDDSGELSKMSVAVWDVEAGARRWALPEPVYVSHEANPHFIGNDPKLVFDPTGTRVAVIGSVYYVENARLFDVATGALVGSLDIEPQLGGEPPQHNLGLEVAFSADGRSVATCSSHGAVRRWMVAPFSATATFEGARQCFRIAFAGDLVVTHGLSDSPDPTKPSLRHTLVWKAGERAPRVLDSKVLIGVFAASSELIAMAGVDNEVELWTTGGTKLATIDAGVRIRRLALAKDGASLVGAGDGDRFFVWDTAALAQRHAVEAHTEWVGDLALAPDGTLVTAGANDRRVRVWKLRGDHAPHAAAVVAGLAGNLWVTVGPSGTTFRRLDTGASAGSSPFALGALPERSDENRDFLASRDGRRIAIAQWNTDEASRATVIDPSGGAPVAITEPIPPGGFQHGSRLSGDGRYVLDIASTGPRVLDARDGHLVRAWQLGAGAFPDSKPGELNMRAVDRMMHRRGGAAMAVSGRSGPDEIDADISADGARVVVGAGDRLLLLDVASGEATEIAKPAGHHVPVFDPTGRTFAAIATSTKAGTHHERSVFRYDVVARKALPAIAIAAPVTALAWSADGRRLLTRSDRGTLDVWDVGSTRHLLAVGEAHAYAASADGERVAVAADEGLAIDIWEVATARKIARLPVGALVEEVSFSSDGTRLLSMAHGRANLWDVHLEARSADDLAAAIARFSRWKLVDGILVAP